MPTIESVDVGVEIGLKVFGADNVVDAVDAALDVAPHAFDVVGVDSPSDVLFGMVSDSGVEVTESAKPVVAGHFVGVDHLPSGDVLLNHRYEGTGLNVGNDFDNGLAVPFHHTRNDSLSSRSTTALAGPLAADVSLIDFDLPKELEVALGHEFADLVEHTPSRLVGDAKLTLQLLGGNARAGGGHEEHGVEPGAQRSGGLVEDGVGGRGDVRAAVFATVDLAASNAVVGGDVLTGNAVDAVGPSGVLNELQQASSSGNWALNCLSVYFFMAP